MIKADLHVHTHYSWDSLLSPEAIIEICQKKGIGCVAITDHNTIAGALELRKLAPFPIIIGEEVKTTRGEISGLFLSQKIPAGLSPEETIARMKEQGGVVYVPHPLDRVRRSALGERNLLRIIEAVDVLEVFNSRVTLPRDNQRARELAKARGLLCGAGSDAHLAYEIGRAYVELPPFEGKEEFLESLAQGRIVGQWTTPLVHLITGFAKIRRRRP